MKTIKDLKEGGKEVTPAVVAKVVKKVEKEKEAEKAVVKVIANEGAEKKDIVEKI